MAANDTAALVVALSAQMTKFEKQMTSDAPALADKAVKNIEDKFARTNPDASGLIAWGKNFLGIVGIAEFLDKLKNAVLEVGKLGQEAERVGLSAEQFQELGYAVVATGGAVESAGSFLDRFNRLSSEAAQGQGALAQVFKANGVAIRDNSGNLLPVYNLLLKYADLVKGAANAQDKMNLAFIAGGRGAGPELVRALEGGAAGLKAFADQAHAAGAVIDDDLVKRAEQVRIAWETKKLAVQSYLIAIADYLLKAKADAQSLIAPAEAKKDVRDLIDQFKELGEVISKAFAERGGLELIAAIKAEVEGAKRTFGAGGMADALRNDGEPVPLPRSRPASANAPSGGGTTVIPNPEFDKMLEHQRKRAELLQAEAQTIGQTIGKEAELRAQIELESQAREHNIPLTEARKAAIEAEAAAVGKAAQQLDDYKRKWQGTNEALRYGGGLLVDALDAAINKTQTWQETATAALRSVTRELLQAAITGQGALAQILGFASNVQGGTGGLVGMLANAFGLGLPGADTAGGSPGGLPMQAAGGTDFSPGGPTWVGEQGPELLNLPRGSQVIPNNVVQKMGGGDSVNVTMSVDLAGANGDAAIRAMIRQSAHAAVSQAVGIVNAQAPARQLKYNQLGT